MLDEKSGSYYRFLKTLREIHQTHQAAEALGILLELDGSGDKLPVLIAWLTNRQLLSGLLADPRFTTKLEGEHLRITEDDVAGIQKAALTRVTEILRDGNLAKIAELMASSETPKSPSLRSGSA